jgi:putative tsp protein
MSFVNRIFNKIVALLLFLPFLAFADIPPPPPSFVGNPHGTPAEVRVYNQTVQRGGQVYFQPQSSNNGGFNMTNGSRPQFSVASTNGSAVMAGKSHPATFHDYYGNKTGGTFKTQTRIPNSTVAKGFGAVMVGTMAANHLDNLTRQGVADQISRGFSDGDWTAVAAGVGKIFDFTGFGSSLANAFYGDSSAANEVMSPLRDQALRQARSDFDKFQSQRQQIDPNATYTHIVVHEWDGTSAAGSSGGTVTEYLAKGAAPWRAGQSKTKDWPSPITINGTTITNKLPADENHWMSIDNTTVSGRDAIAIQAKINMNLEQYVPNEAAWEKAMEQFLNQSHQNNDAIRDLINALWEKGAIGMNNTETTVSGSAADNTFVTAPYTPSDGKQAQQTQFKVNPDGSVTVNTIPRPDLPANSAAAPTKSPAPNKQGEQQQGEQNQQGQQNKQSGMMEQFCNKFPNLLFCAKVDEKQMDGAAKGGGDGDVKFDKPPKELNSEDVDALGKKVADYKKANTVDAMKAYAYKQFVGHETAACPAPAQFTVKGKTISVPYDHFCTFLLLIRPFVIACFALLTIFFVIRNLH